MERGTMYLKVSNMSNQKVKIPKIMLGVEEKFLMKISGHQVMGSSYFMILIPSS